MRRGSLAACVAAVAALVASPGALADGTEALGPPSVPVAQATNVLVAGVGMQAFPNANRSFSFTVPAGATIKQVLLYWQGHWTDHGPYWANTPQVDGDDTISVNGSPVTGAKIGGSTAFFGQFAGAVEGTEKFVAYRADITARSLVSPGANTLTIGDMLFRSNFPGGFPFDQGNDGAGVVVLYDHGAGSSVVGVRDGLDLAFEHFAAPLQTTVPQTFTFAPAATDRPATLATLAGDVAGPDVGGLRGNALRVTFDVGAPVTLTNPWQSHQGGQLDASNLAVTVPAGASSMTVQALSQGGDAPASFAWIAASVSIQSEPPAVGGQGCTPGYWKNHDGSKKQGNAWTPTGYSPGQLLSSVFDPAALGTLGSATLRQALDWGGGSTLEAKKRLLLHHAVAALLNAAHPGVSYPMTTAQIVSAVNAALASNNAAGITTLKDQLDTQNNAGCPLGRA